MKISPPFCHGVLILAVFTVMAMPLDASSELDVVGNSSLIMRGAVKTVGAAMQVPIAMLQDSGRVMFPFGIVTGAIRGSVRTVAGVISGAFDIAQGGGPYAKYMGFM